MPGRLKPFPRVRKGIAISLEILTMEYSTKLFALPHLNMLHCAELFSGIAYFDTGKTVLVDVHVMT